MIHREFQLEKLKNQSSTVISPSLMVLFFMGGVKQGPKFQAGLDQCIWTLGNQVLRLICLLTGVNVEQLTIDTINHCL